jgi:IS30 family transposase
MRTTVSISYSVRQAAWILGVSPSTIYRSIRLGTLRLDSRGAVPASALVKLLKDRPEAAHDR